MPIFDQGYQHYSGPRTGTVARIGSIVRRGAQPLFSRWMVRLTLLASLVPMLLLVAFLVLWSLIEQRVSWVQPIIDMMRLPEEMTENTAQYRGAVWTLLFEAFFMIQTPLALLMTLLVGPNLISQDLRFNAIPLYLSRPVDRIHYFLGKFGVIFLFVGGSLLVPILAGWVLGILFSLDWRVAIETLPLLIGAVIYATAVTLSLATLMLAFSSLSKNAILVGAFWIGFILITGTPAGAISALTRDRQYQALGYNLNFVNLRHAMLGTGAAYAKWRDGLKAIEDQTKRVSAMGPLGGMLERMERQAKRAAAKKGVPTGKNAGAAGKNAPPPPPNQPTFDPNSATDKIFKDLIEPAFPVTWTWGILGGIFLLSVLTLSQRIKSLDRLK
jgi:ABC-2 type transport system permease protein